MSFKFFSNPTSLANSVKKLVTLKGLVGFDNDFKGVYFHHHFYIKAGVKSL